jgi:hypothetical protein
MSSISACISSLLTKCLVVFKRQAWGRHSPWFGSSTTSSAGYRDNVIAAYFCANAALAEAAQRTIFNQYLILHDKQVITDGAESQPQAVQRCPDFISTSESATNRR